MDPGSPTELVKVEYMTRENISMANLLSTFDMASKLCLKNFHLYRDQRERLFNQFCATMVWHTWEKIMLQLTTVCKTCRLGLHFNSMLTNLVLIKQDACLNHTQLLSGLMVSKFVSNHFYLCVGSTPSSGNVEDLCQYDLGC